MRIAVLAGLVSFAACGRDDPAPPPSALAATDSVSVNFQVTGLVLMVPPKQAGDPTRAVLPKAAGHRAAFAFGLRQNIPRLCMPYKNGVCYVDLAQWHLQGVGRGGSPANMTTVPLPPGVLNVTANTGGVFFVDTRTAKNKVLTEVDFYAGRPSGTHCALGRWRHSPVTATGQVQAARRETLVNMLNWTMWYPSGDAITVGFVKKTGGDPLVVPLEARWGSSVHVMLANIPSTDFNAILADQTIQLGTSDTLAHVRNYYDLLRSRSKAPVPERRRSIPVLVEQIEPECEVVLTTVPSDTSPGITPTVTLGPKTYACVVGTGST